jgi:hypothetical protein
MFFQVLIIFCLIGFDLVFGDFISIDPKLRNRFYTIFEKNNSFGYGKPCSDRVTWKNLKSGISSSVLLIANQTRDSKMPAWKHEDYLKFYKTGSRIAGEKMMNARFNRIRYLVLGECFYWDRSFLDTLSRDLVDISNQRSWTFPAHDRSRRNLKRRYTVSLHSANIAGTLGQTLYLLGNRLNNSVKTQIRRQLRSRIFEPLKMAMKVKDPSHWWMNSTSNWNAVCLTGVISAALGGIKSPQEKAFFISFAWQTGFRFLEGFKRDGFSSEGLWYFNYGFGYFSLLREVFFKSIHPDFDYFKFERVQQIARFAEEYPMSDLCASPIGDTRFGAFISPALQTYISLYLNISAVNYPNNFSMVIHPILLGHIVALFHNNKLRNIEIKLRDKRKYYNNSGILIARPTADSRNTSGLFGTFKLGGNGGGHSHNDIGSYAICVDGDILSGDVGGPEFYESKTFTSQRFRSKLLNSYGHPVPVVNNVLQQEAIPTLSKKRKPFVSNYSFSDSRDTLSFNLRDAYKDPLLSNLERTFDYQRFPFQSIKITDSVQFTKNSPFEVAMTTRFSWFQTSPTSGFFRKSSLTSSKSLYAKIESSHPYSIQSETIIDYGVSFERISIKLLENIQNASISVTFSQTPIPQ